MMGEHRLSRLPSTTTGMSMSLSMRQSLKHVGSSFRLRPAKPKSHPNSKPSSTSTATATKTTGSTSISHHTDSTTTFCTSGGVGGDESVSELSTSAAFHGAIEDEYQRKRRLVLTNFIENATKEDLRRLRCILRHSSAGSRRKSKCNWHLVKFNDVSSATNYRRWQFKKDNVIKHIKDVVAEQHIVLRFHCILDIEFHCNSADAIGRLFTEVVRKDPDIVAIHLKGSLEPTKATLVIPRLIHLLTEDQRHWEKVVFAPEYYAHANTDTCSTTTTTTWNNNYYYAQWKHSMQRHARQLEELSEKRGIPMGIHIVS